ncbi:mucolipin-3-like isoform X2 [Dysidea avara]|uniref:mucolipin-3-like isoform X2 n=1 Tax=Dysidea avara TaxID=196820 RepID=UPI003320541C
MGTDLESGRHNQESFSELNPTLVWCLTNLFHFTIGPCYNGCKRAWRLYSPRDDPYSSDRELTDYMSEEREPLINEDNEWTTKIQKERADHRIKKRLQLHFQDHIQKWSRDTHPRFPWKAVLHLLLVVFVTVQVSIFAADKFKLTSFLVENTKSFHHYFIRKECNDRINKLYSLDDVYEQIEHTVNSYYSLSQQSLTMIIDFDIGQCGNSNAFPCKDKNLTSHTKVFPYNPDSSTDIRPEDKPCCNEDSTSSSCSIEYCECSVKSQVDCYIHGDNLDTIGTIKFGFMFDATYDKGVIEEYNSVQVHFHIVISLDNKLYNNLEVDIDTTPTFSRLSNNFLNRKRTTIIDIVVLILLILSSCTYILSIFQTSNLTKDVKLHFLAYHERHLRWQEISPLYNYWYMMMLFTNLLIFAATLLKVYSDYDAQETINIDLLEAISILLGIGILLLWCGLFGLLKYFESLNVLLITVRLALPSILRFAIYIVILFTAFSLCGWLVLGSYHSKFGGPMETAVSLFCILNGDDLYETFTGVEVPSNSVQMFCKLYLFVFMFMFIYIVLSLFIGIFNHAYESLSKNWKQHSRGFLRDWAEGEPDDDPTKNYPFPIPRIRKPVPVTPVLDPVCINASGDSSLVSSVVIEEHPIANNNACVPVVHITDSTSEPVNDNVATGRGLVHYPSDSNLLAQPQSQEVRRLRSESFSPSAAVDPAVHTTHGHHHHHNFAYTSGGTHLMVHHPRAQVAEPPVANSKEVAKARLKLRASNQELNLDVEESDS